MLSPLNKEVNKLKPLTLKPLKSKLSEKLLQLKSPKNSKLVT